MDHNLSCQICGKLATGVHYGVAACAGCTVFFKRSTIKNSRYFCYASKKCSVSVAKKFRCKACRFAICVDLGMKLPRQMNDAVPYSANPVAETCLSSAECSPHSISGCHDPTQHTVEPRNSSDCSEEKTYILSGPLALLTNPLIVNENKFTPFDSGCIGNLDHNQRQIAVTLAAVSRASENLYGDQTRRWAAFRDAVIRNSWEIKGVHEKAEVTREEMVIAVNGHNSDLIIRSQTFASMLPGMAESTTGKGSTAVGWKFLVYWMIHHAPFITSTENYITVGPNQLHFSNYWQNIVSAPLLIRRMRTLSAEFRAIGLNETERYLLMAVVMFEPGDVLEDVQLAIMHRHYTDVLLHHMKRRCSSQVAFLSICQRLENFFGTLKSVSWLHGQLFTDNWMDCPTCSLQAKAKVIQLYR